MLQNSLCPSLSGSRKTDIWCFFVLFGMVFADEMAGCGLDDTRRTNGICDFLQEKFVMEIFNTVL